MANTTRRRQPGPDMGTSSTPGDRDGYQSSPRMAMEHELRNSGTTSGAIFSTSGHGRTMNTSSTTTPSRPSYEQPEPAPPPSSSSSSSSFPNQHPPSLYAAAQQPPPPPPRMSTIHPSRCPPLDLKFLWKLYHQRQQLDTLNMNMNMNMNNNHHHDHTTFEQHYDEHRQILQSQGFPLGLASRLLQHTQNAPIRIWLIDNSGTMHRDDGHIVVQTSEGKVEIVDCSRWQEVSTTLRWHAELAAWVQTPLAIRFLHDPGSHVGPQQLGVSASKHHNANEEVSRLKALLHKICPTGASASLQNHLQELMTPIEAILPQLEQSQRHLVVCLCTDSIPKNEQGVESPESMQELGWILEQLTASRPVQVVLRLLTDEARVVHFYQSLLPRTVDVGVGAGAGVAGGTHDPSFIKLQVLDDYISECRCVQEHNPWLHYGYPLHLCREQGISIPVVEDLSRRPLNPTEVLQVLRILFVDSFSTTTTTTSGSGNNSSRHIRSGTATSSSSLSSSSLVQVRRRLDEWNEQAGVLWNPIKKRFVPWVDIKKLDQCYQYQQESTSSSSHHGGGGGGMQHDPNHNNKCSLM